MSVDIRTTVKGPVLRGFPFEAMSRSVLGSAYDLSVVVCGDHLAQKMNKKYRKKSYRPNVLSFELDKNEGEIFLNLRCAEREAKRFGVTLKSRLALLFVHGLFHLKGMDHGDKMERLERNILKRFETL